MARKFVSPGVFTQEIDQSYLAQGVAAIGAAVIGRTLKGPAFVPTPVTDFNGFVTKFGDVDPGLQMPYAAKNYLKNANSLTVVRVLGTDDGNGTLSNGSTQQVLAITGTLSSSVGGQTESVVLAVLHVPVGFSATLSGTGTGSTFTYDFSGSTISTGHWAGTASFDPKQSNYVGRVFNTNPTKTNAYGHYLYKNFKWAHEANTVTIAGNAGTSDINISSNATSSFDRSYSTSKAPTIVSQNFGSVKYPLFQFETLSAGEASTTEIKVSIVNIQATNNPAVTPFGTFDVIVRAWNDTDQRMTQIETYTNCDLNPKSTNYIARRIGDQKFVWDDVNRKNTVSGVFRNVSKYIRVDMSSADYDDAALPWGHLGYADDNVDSGNIADVPVVQDNLDANGNVEVGHIWGIDLTKSGIEDRLKARSANAATVTGADFSLAHVSASVTGGINYCVYNTAHSETSTTEATASGSLVAPARNGFTVVFAGGFDGFDMTLADPLAGGTPYAVASQKAAVDAVSNPDEIDMNVLAIPGITTFGVTDYARSICNQRADCMMIMDIPGSSVNDAIGQVNTRGIDDNYVACYYPDLRYSDTTNNVLVQVKPSVAVLGAYAFSDRVKAPYFAPAGLNRGGLSQFGIVDTVDRLTFQDRNDLYEARINPIATFPNEGIVVFGQKTMQARPSALDRVNVRRLLIYAKKTIASAARYLLFEPNNQNTWQRFLNTVNPILEDVRMAQGLERFKVVMDASVNTPDLVDRNIMTGKIFLQPTRAAEYIDLSFVITSSGVSFGE